MSISNILGGQDLPHHDVKSVMTQNGRTFASYSDGSTLITSNTPGEYPVRYTADSRTKILSPHSTTSVSSNDVEVVDSNHNYVLVEPMQSGYQVITTNTFKVTESSNGSYVSVPADENTDQQRVVSRTIGFNNCVADVDEEGNLVGIEVSRQE